MASGKRDALGSFLGIVTFLGGVGLLLFVFQRAYVLFETPQQDALGLKGAKSIDFGMVGNSLTNIIVRIVLLLVMGIVGSLIANRGITMYTHSRHLGEHPHPSKEKVG